MQKPKLFLIFEDSALDLYAEGFPGLHKIGDTHRAVDKHTHRAVDKHTHRAVDMLNKYPNPAPTPYQSLQNRAQRWLKPQKSLQDQFCL